MKKVFSLLLVVAMLVSLSVVASAAEPNAAGGMHTVITETDTDITVDIYVKNVANMAGFNSILLTDDVEMVANSAVLGEKFASGKLTVTTTKAGQIKLVHTFTDLSQYVTDTGSLLAVSYKVTKVEDGNTELAESDFAYGTSTLTVSKIGTGTGGTVAGVAAGNNYTSAKQPAGFTIAYVDDRAPAVEPDKFINDEGANGGVGTITFYGRVGADWLDQDYGVIVEGKDFFGAKNGDIVADGEGTKTFEFDAWDGNFEIIMTNITEKGTAGTKTYQFFVGENLTEEATVVVE